MSLLNHRSVLIAASAFCFLLLSGAAKAEDLLDEPTRPSEGLVNVPPIKVAPGTRLRADVLARHRIWYERVLVAPLRERCRGKKWEAVALKFAQDSADDLYLTFARRHGRFAALYEEGSKVVETGCDDLLILYLFERLKFRKDEDEPRAQNTYRALFERSLHTVGLGPALPGLLGKDFALALGKNDFDEKVMRKIAEWLTSALADGSYSSDDGEIFLQHQLAPGWLSLNDRMPEILRPVYDSAPFPEWAKHTLRGRLEIRLAWRARGGEYANKVTSEGWKGFAEHLEKARSELTESWKLRPDQPEAATEMITVVMAGKGNKGDTERLWFDRATAAQFDYFPAYTYTLSAYRPRWGGSIELMFSFGRACAETRRYDTDVPLILYHACSDIVAELPDWPKFFRRSEIAEPILELSQALTTEPTRQYERPARDSLLVIYAWMCGDFQLASQTLATIPKLDPDALARFDRIKISERTLREEVGVYASAGRTEYVAADLAYKSGDLAAARRGFEVAAKKEVPAEVQALITSRLEVVSIEETLATGRWVKLPARPELREWTVQNGTWEADRAGILINKGLNNTASIFHQARVGSEFELRADFELADNSSVAAYGLGFAFGGGGNKSWTLCQVNKAGDKVTARLLDHYSPSGVKNATAKVLPKTQLFVRGAGEKVTFECNGERVYDAVDPGSASTGPEDGRVGIGAYFFTLGTVTKITNIEVRRLTTP